eukprot:scaffold62592_cov28-Phaeocystis_antarctica.AAC.2
MVSHRALRRATQHAGGGRQLPVQRGYARRPGAAEYEWREHGWKVFRTAESRQITCLVSSAEMTNHLTGAPPVMRTA